MNTNKLILGLVVVVVAIVALGLARQKQMRDDFASKHPPSAVSVPAGLMMVHYGASW